MSAVLECPEPPTPSNQTQPESGGPIVTELEVFMHARLDDINAFYKNGWLEMTGRQSKSAKKPVNEEWKDDLYRREEQYLGSLSPDAAV